MAHIVCYRSGEAFVSRRVPKGSMKIVTGHGRRLRRILSVCARQAYDGKTLLVPGLPEAEGDLQAIEAVKGFEQMLRERLALGPHRRTKGRRLI
ncbi:host nuclease inhibitor protein [Agrobacterium rosae]|uniref:Host nuclease inhibitor protein n=1 Tax=Agrobacterium rosae TaxID=1972867 RepID=A0AAW9FFU1_9HYPH|nr:host nuclease inhibitor protein [Agrobacterium rosae]MDX8301464.1 host nuclease inhibitor protein [Agrobacterium rosae]